MLAETRNVPHVKNALFNYTTHEVRNTTLLPTTEYHLPYCLLYYLPLQLHDARGIAIVSSKRSIVSYLPLLLHLLTTYRFNYTTHEVSST